MPSSLEAILESGLFRALSLQPSNSREDAIARVHKSMSDSGLLGLDAATIVENLNRLAQRYQRYGVINPNWLASQGLKPHFFLVNAESGWLEQLVADSEAQRDGISQYIVYGDYDSLIILQGTSDEASRLLKTIDSSRYHNVNHFSVKSIPLLYGYQPEPVAETSLTIDAEIVNRVALDFDSPDLVAERKELIERRIILGPVWKPNAPGQTPLTAFIGIALRGRFPVDAAAVLQALQTSQTLRESLVHLFQTDEARPYDYFAKLSCRTMAELDRATNEIGATRIGQIHCEGATFVVANGRDQLPIYRSQGVTRLITVPRFEDVEDVAREMIGQLGGDAIDQLNRLPAAQKLVALRSFDELSQQLGRREWDEQRDSSIRSVVEHFLRLSLRTDASFSGPVTDTATCLEELLRYVVRRIAESEFGKDFKRAQNELALSNRDFRRLTLGNMLTALRNARGHSAFAYLEGVLEVEWLERLDRFAQGRNEWVHTEGQKGMVGARRMEEAKRVIVEGIEIIRWLSGVVLPHVGETRTEAKSEAAEEVATAAASPPPEVELPELRSKMDFGVFVSHSSHDGQVAESIAARLQAFDFSVWYSEWSIGPSDSIVEKINEGLSKHDTLLVLLSPESVKSAWVKRELNYALRQQLLGQNVTVVPLLIRECEIPPVLADIKYIDMRRDFLKGFSILLDFLLRRRGETPVGSASGTAQEAPGE